MKSKLSCLSIWLLALGTACAAGCAKDNSVGPDTVTGGGGTTGSGQGGQSSTGFGGSSPIGTGVGGSGAVGTVDSGTSSDGSIDTGSITGAGGFVSSTGAGGSGPATTGSGGHGTGAGGSPGTTTGTGGSNPGGPVVIMAGGDSKCAATASATSMLCDGFEGPAVGAAGSVWKDAAGAGSTAVVDTTKPYRGKNSVHIKTNGGAGLITETSTFNQTGTLATNDNMWGRFFIWFSQTGNPQSHSVFITLEDPMSNLMSAQFHEAGGSRGYLNTGIRFDSPASDHYLPPMGTGMINFDTETPAWHCWEWHTTADAAGNTTSDFYIDGAIDSQMSVTAADKWPLPVFRSMSVGFMQFGTTPATELWIDEVAVDASATPSRIGCNN
jgi:hypothetical protein